MSESLLPFFPSTASGRDPYFSKSSSISSSLRLFAFFLVTRRKLAARGSTPYLVLLLKRVEMSPKHFFIVILTTHFRSFLGPTHSIPKLLGLCNVKLHQPTISIRLIYFYLPTHTKLSNSRNNFSAVIFPPYQTLLLKIVKTHLACCVLNP